jgi:oligopeptide transport system ATP-binding protein
MPGEPLLDVRGLAVSFQRDRDAPVSQALRGVDLSVTASEIHGLVGESGCGKTVTSTAVMGLLPAPPARIEGGSIVFDGRDLLGLSPEERRKVRGRQVAMVFQEPARYLNPSLRVGGQITEMLRLHLARRVLRAYPHELSGGMKQRAMIAMAISCNPRLLIADEPTTALDVTLQMQILRLIVRLRETFRMGILFISHDLRLVRTVADRVTVMYAGRAVETASARGLYREALHPYTRLLLASIPAAQKRGTRLRVIPGRVPDAQAVPAGCAFHPRCPIAEERCRTEMPECREQAAGHAAACHFVGKSWPD